MGAYRVYKQIVQLQSVDEVVVL